MLNSLVPGDSQETITILIDSRNSEHRQKLEGDLYLLVIQYFSKVFFLTKEYMENVFYFLMSFLLH